MSVTVPAQQDAGTLITDTLYNEIVDAVAHVLGLKVGEDAISDLSSNMAIMPSGVVMPFAASTVPSGWLLCDGSAVSRTTYADLYTLIEETYGNGDGSITFNLPDLRGRVIGGKDDMGGTGANRITNSQADSLGGSTGTESQALTTAQMPAHNHGQQNQGQTAYYENANSGRRGFAAGNTDSWTREYTGSAGSGNSHNNIQPTLFLNYIIKT